jgi:hypothetical protein
LEKEKREGVMDKMSIFFLSIQNRTEEGAHRGDLPAADGGRPGYGGGREWGNTERRSRATRSCPHLGLGRLVEGDRRRRAVCNTGGLWRAAVGAQGRERVKCLGGAG